MLRISWFHRARSAHRWCSALTSDEKLKKTNSNVLRSCNLLSDSTSFLENSKNAFQWLETIFESIESKVSFTAVCFVWRKLLVQKKIPQILGRTMTWHDRWRSFGFIFPDAVVDLIRRNGSCFPGENWPKRLPSAWRFSNQKYQKPLNLLVQEKLKTPA